MEQGEEDGSNMVEDGWSKRDRQRPATAIGRGREQYGGGVGSRGCEVKIAVIVTTIIGAEDRWSERKRGRQEQGRGEDGSNKERNAVIIVDDRGASIGRSRVVTSPRWLYRRVRRSGVDVSDPGVIRKARD